MKMVGWGEIATTNRKRERLKGNEENQRKKL